MKVKELLGPAHLHVVSRERRAALPKQAKTTPLDTGRQAFDIPHPMHQANSILIRAPKERIFETAADLEQWPRILPHYRYIHFYERGPTRNVVKMAAVRSGIPIAWTSEQVIDRDAWEVRFHHLKAFTKGMEVVWTFTQTAGGVRVEIVHDLRFRVPALQGIADRIIGGFFIENIATKTLRCMKRHLESGAAAPAGV